MRPINRYILITVTICLLFSLTACNLFGKDTTQTPTATQPTATATETLQPTATSTVTPTATPTVTPTAAPTRTPVTRLDDGDGGQNMNYWQDTVTALRVLVGEQQLPDYYLDPEAPVTEEEFDPNLLLEPLTHLHMRSGYTLDFVYWMSDLGGYPIIYAHKTTVARFESIEAFDAAYGECNIETNPASCHYSDLIETDGSQEGYFELSLVQMMGEQFYQFWHAYYNDLQIVASQERLEEIIEMNANEDFGYKLTEEQINAAREIDFTPVVVIDSDSVTVRFVYFTYWGGFYDVTVEILLTRPYQYELIEEDNVVPYDCGVLF
ncbi:hypothetical protein JR338_10550 [Chloroflexota bacterium]|nr:hypothetical protein JR338_10550 [Chloroflexota bacterium]